MYRSTATGIIYNDQMADFDNPGDANIGGLYPSPSNFPEPGKRPFSSVTPVIFTDKQGNVRFVVGASGGKKIITATSLVGKGKRENPENVRSYLEKDSPACPVSWSVGGKRVRRTTRGRSIKPSFQFSLAVLGNAHQRFLSFSLYPERDSSL